VNILWYNFWNRTYADIPKCLNYRLPYLVEVHIIFCVLSLRRVRRGSWCYCIRCSLYCRMRRRIDRAVRQHPVSAVPRPLPQQRQLHLAHHRTSSESLQNQVCHHHKPAVVPPMAGVDSRRTATNDFGSCVWLIQGVLYIRIWQSMANSICHADLFELSAQGNISTRRRANINLVHSLVFPQKNGDFSRYS